jgi:hypothetical protein
VADAVCRGEMLQFGRARKGQNLNTADTEKNGGHGESGRELRLQRAGFGRLEAKEPASG